MILLAFILLFLTVGCSSPSKKKGNSQYNEQAKRVTIIRDEWGIPHIYGKTDADAVFGLMYAQCEESFERVERAYIERLGRLSEIEGEKYIYRDLKTRLIFDTAAAIKDYHNSPMWLKELLHAFTDGIHYYLEQHPDVEPRLLKKFEPWFPLLFTDGAYVSTKTGGLTIEDVKYFYEDSPSSSRIELQPSNMLFTEMHGSNAFVIGPSKSATGNALLYINPHVSFYFRTEMHMVSEEGLNAYGAVTWGQFFVFQGFNEHCGWMHTSSDVDVADLYEETIVQQGTDYYYQYDGQLRPVVKKKISIQYGNMNSRSFTTYSTHHGPVMSRRNNNWITLKHQNRSLNGLIQSWQRMKAKNLQEFTATLQLKANSTTNTMYADTDGNIAYWHGNFIPKRAAHINTDLPLDGTTSATEWQGAHDLNEIIHVINPPSGFLQNCNSSPYSVAGAGAVTKTFPKYMAPEGENFRSIYAIHQLSGKAFFTLNDLIHLGYDHRLAAFDTLLPPLFAAYHSLAVSDPLYNQLREPIDTLKNWNRKSSVHSAATSLAIFWAYNLLSNSKAPIPDNIANDGVKQIAWYSSTTPAMQKLEILRGIVDGLQRMYGTWKVKWGDINRFQKLSTTQPSFDNDAPSFPTSMGPAFLGSLPAYETVWVDNKQYGVAGNSFVAAVEFVKGDSAVQKRVKARSVIAGGKSFDPSSKNFLDQAELYISGRLKDVWFYKDDVLKHAVKSYQLGE